MEGHGKHCGFVQCWINNVTQHVWVFATTLSILYGRHALVWTPPPRLCTIVSDKLRLAPCNHVGLGHVSPVWTRACGETWPFSNRNHAHTLESSRSGQSRYMHKRALDLATPSKNIRPHAACMCDLIRRGRGQAGPMFRPRIGANCHNDITIYALAFWGA